MGQHNNYYAKVCFLPFQSQDPSPPLRCMIIVQLCTVDCSLYCCKQHRSLYRPLYSVKTIDIVCRRSRSIATFNTRIA